MKPHSPLHRHPGPIFDREVRHASMPMPSIRGLAAGSLAVGVGLLILLTSQGGVASADLPVLGVLFVGALVGGSAADRMAERRLASEAPKGWMTVVVTSSGPSEAQADKGGPRVTPRSGPERRRLSRLSRGKRRDSVSSSV